MKSYRNTKCKDTPHANDDDDAQKSRNFGIGWLEDK